MPLYISISYYLVVTHPITYLWKQNTKLIDSMSYIYLTQFINLSRAGGHSSTISVVAGNAHCKLPIEVWHTPIFHKPSFI